MQRRMEPPYCQARRRQQSRHVKRSQPQQITTVEKPITTTAPLAFKSVLGRGSVIPNLYYTAIPQEQLRHYHTRFVGLPPVDELTITSDSSTFKYVRQSHPLWTQLHTGRLTTSRLNAALGLTQVSHHDRPPSKYLSPFQMLRNHSQYQPLTHNVRLQRYNTTTGAYAVITEPAWTPETATAAGYQDEQTALQHNECQRERLWSNKLPESAIPRHGIRQGSSDRNISALDRKKQVSEQLALQGPMACRLQWGSIQEAAALNAVADIFPQSILEEVGLMAIDATSIPSSWGCQPNELPAMGASPDGLIVHTLCIPHEKILSARSEILGSPAASCRPESVPDGLRIQAEASAFQLIHEAVESLPLGPVYSTNIPGHDSQQTATGGSAVTRAQTPPSTLASPDADHHNEQLLKPLQASPLRPLPLTFTNQDSLKWLADVILGLWTLPPATTQTTEGVARGPGPYQDEYGTAYLPWREVVECKNHCPFALKEHRKARKGRTMLRYIVREWSPLQELKCDWLAQLQWHCLAAGTHSALLVSRTPSKGVSVFRVYRDNDWLMLAMQIIKHVHVMYTSRGQLPPSDVLYQPELRPLHQACQAATTELASSAKLVVTRSGHRLPLLPHHIQPPPGSDRNSIWVIDDK